MKKLLTATLLTASLSVSANCDDIAGLAKTVMETRQSGVSMSNMMKVAESDKGALGRIMKGMTIQAYKKPAYHGKELQQRMINDFEDKWYMLCIERQK